MTICGSTSWNDIICLDVVELLNDDDDDNGGGDGGDDDDRVEKMDQSGSGAGVKRSCKEFKLDER